MENIELVDTIFGLQVILPIDPDTGEKKECVENLQTFLKYHFKNGEYLTILKEKDKFIVQ